MNKQGVLEGILFAVGDEGINLDSICEILEISKEEAKEVLLKLKNSYDAEDRGIRVSYLGDCFKLTTKKEHKDYFTKLIENPKTNTLSNSCLETLAIIAYNQPITRIEIDELRGVSSAHLIRKLVAKGLVKEAGKSKLPGRPNLYRTTSDFLDYFGLATIGDLPTIFSEEKEEKESDLYTSIYKEDINE